MRTPAFWGESPGWRARLLAPAGWIYGAITAWRMGRSGDRASIPVVCVGNFTAGGAGKTPTALMLADALAARGETPIIISRGHGGRTGGPERVDPARHTAADCGDEPLLLARRHPVIVSRDRRKGAQLAAAQGATVALLDDGLQNPSLAKDFTIAVVDGGFGLGNGYCVPAGPLRAPVEAQMTSIDAVFILGEGEAGAKVAASPCMAGIPVFPGRLEHRRSDLAALSGRRLLAFAGIGRPEKFFQMLSAAGLDVGEKRAFADHHPFTQAEAQALLSAAEAGGMVLVTTEKDLMRWPAAIAPAPAVVRVEAATGSLDMIMNLVEKALNRRRSAI